VTEPEPEAPAEPRAIIVMIAPDGGLLMERRGGAGMVELMAAAQFLTWFVNAELYQQQAQAQAQAQAKARLLVPVPGGRPT